MSELIKLDPVEIAEDRTELEITSWVKAEGIDWGDAEIDAYMADHAIGSSPVDYRLPNRKVDLPLTLRTVGTVTYSTIRTKLQEKVARLQQESGWASRVSDGTALFMDVENATLHLGGSWMTVRGAAPTDIDATLSLDVLPDFYASPISLDVVGGTGTITQVLRYSSAQAVIRGHYPGRVQMTVAAAAGTDRHGLLWGFRSRHYSSAATAALAIDAENMTLPTGASTTGMPDASGASVVQRTLTSSWADVLITDLVSSGALTHRGSYRVWARVQSSATGQSIRLLWSVGELASPVTNAVSTTQANWQWLLVDLGEIRLDANPVGTHKWIGHLQAAGSGVLYVDQLLFQPLDEGAGQLVGYESSLEPGQVAPAVVYGGRDCLVATTGMFTMVSTGDGYMQMSEVYGSLPRIPVSGLEARPVELFLRTTRGDFDAISDANGATDVTTVTCAYWPSYLFRP